MVYIIDIKRIKVNNKDNITFEKEGGKLEVTKELSRSRIMKASHLITFFRKDNTTTYACESHMFHVRGAMRHWKLKSSAVAHTEKRTVLDNHVSELANQNRLKNI